MIESKTIYVVLAFIGVPAFIKLWFLELTSGWDLAKTIALAVIAIGLGLFALIRSLIKTIDDVIAFRDRMKARIKGKK